MSNSRRPKRNMKVLMARFAAGVQERGEGGYFASVQHDEDCLGLRYQFMLECTCMPEINIAKVR
jgi:hypothetical protein